MRSIGSLRRVLAGRSREHDELGAGPIVRRMLGTSVLICAVLLVPVALRFAIQRIQGYGFDPSLNTLRVMLALTQYEKEFTYPLYLIGGAFILINFISQKTRTFLVAGFATGAYLWVVYRIFNLVIIYYAGSHIDKTFVVHMDLSRIGMLADYRTILMVLIPIPVAILAGVTVRSVDYSDYDRRTRMIVLLVVGSVFWTAYRVEKFDRRHSFLVTAGINEYKVRYPLTTIAPERFLYESFAAVKEIKHRPPVTTIDDRLIAKLSGFGLRYDKGNPRYPMLRDRVYSEPFPYKAVPGAVDRPNIIFVVMESMSARFINSYGNKMPGLTRNIDRFASLSTEIRPFYNASTPTMNGMISILCSHLPVYEQGAWRQLQIENFDLLCLPEPLGQKGYTSYFVLAGDPNYTNKRSFFTYNGFDEVIGSDVIRRETGEKPYGSWGYSDMQLDHFVIKLLREGRLKEPFMMVVEDVDMHPDYEMKQDTLRYPGDDHILYNLAYTVDAAFGTLLDYFLGSRYSDNTIMVLTADHAMEPGTQYREIFGEDAMRYFDEIPFLLYDPVHKLPKEIDVTSSSIDIAPSILHMLGINIANPFEGLSVFGTEGRASFPNLIGSNPFYHFDLVDGKVDFFYSNETDCDETSAQVVYASATGSRPAVDRQQDGNSLAFTRCDYEKWFRHKVWLLNEGKIWDDGIIGLNVPEVPASRDDLSATGRRRSHAAPPETIVSRN